MGSRCVTIFVSGAMAAMSEQTRSQIVAWSVVV
jgi:hypothetical protein